MVSIAGAAAAYANTAARGQGPGLAPRGEASGSSFADLVKDAAGSTKEALQQNDRLSMQAVTGKADLTEVVTAVTNAEVALQTVVAVRDRVIQAYQDVIRMTI